MTSDGEGVVVVGGGSAAGECVASLRMTGYEGPLTLVAAQKTLPYTLPPLSKAYLLGAVGPDEIAMRPASTYADHDIRLRLGVRVYSIDRAARTVRLADQTVLGYRHLVLATGGRPRQLRADGIDRAPNVHYLRTIDDADALRDRLRPGAHLVVVGGGYLGLEVAAVARRLGARVSVVEAMPRLLARVTAAPVSDFFHRVHREEGVDVRLGLGVVGVEGVEGGAATDVVLSNGERLRADAVLISIGLVPDVELAQAAGLAVDNGIVVDEHCRTSDPAVLAIGDCTNHPCGESGGRRRLESLPNALEQAAVAAATVVGAPKPYRSTPWFWSEQYDVTLQTVGLADPGDDIVLRGAADTGRSFAVFYLRDGCVRAADVVSNPREFAIAKRLVAQRTPIATAVLADVGRPLKEFLTAGRLPSAAVV